MNSGATKSTPWRKIHPSVLRCGSSSANHLVCRRSYPPEALTSARPRSNRSSNAVSPALTAKPYGRRKIGTLDAVRLAILSLPARNAASARAIMVQSPSPAARRRSASAGESTMVGRNGSARTLNQSSTASPRTTRTSLPARSSGERMFGPPARVKMANSTSVGVAVKARVRSSAAKRNAPASTCTRPASRAATRSAPCPGWKVGARPAAAATSRIRSISNPAGTPFSSRYSYGGKSRSNPTTRGAGERPAAPTAPAAEPARSARPAHRIGHRRGCKRMSQLT